MPSRSAPARARPLPRTHRKRKPRLAVWKFSSCDGCQLTFLDCEDELLALAGEVDIVYFPEATSTMEKGPYDISVIEGSIATRHDAERIHDVRRESKVLISIGACATAGGIQALRNFRDHEEMLRLVYARPDYIDSLARSTAMADHVKVDYELRGCPPDKRQLLEVMSAFLHGRRPNVPSHSTCVECKLAGNVCVLVAHGTPCMGPVTHAGCGALCPGYTRGCYGCFGPMEAPNTASLARRLRTLGESEGDVRRSFLSFNANAEAFRKEGLRHED